MWKITNKNLINMKLPTKKQINVFNSLDEIKACDHFFNKTIEEAELLFLENSAYYQEDLMWMGIKAFKFYLEAVIHYLSSDAANEDDHFIDCLYAIISFRENEADFSIAKESVMRMVDYIITNYDKFSVSSEVYGDLLSKYKLLYQKLSDK